MNARSLRAVLAADPDIGAGNVLSKVIAHGADLAGPGLIFDTDFHYTQPPVSCPFCLAFSYHPANRDHRPRDQISDRCHDRPIFVTPRNGPERILHCSDMQSLQDIGALRPYPFNKTNRKIPEIGSARTCHFRMTGSMPW